MNYKSQARTHLMLAVALMNFAFLAAGDVTIARVIAAVFFLIAAILELATSRNYRSLHDYTTPF